MESLKKPPPQSLSRFSTPEETRTLDERWVRRIAPKGKILIPSFVMVKGYSPFMWVVPRSFKISTVRRRRSPSKTLRTMITLSETNSSTPKRAIPPYSSIRSQVMIEVIFSCLRRATSRKISLLTTEAASYC